MSTVSKHPWHELLLAPLAEEKIRQKLADDHADWEYIDSEMVKLGSLSHATLNIAELQQIALRLLAEESKDFRLVSHLLRTLQHAGQAEDVLLAISLLTEYGKYYWPIAWPQNAVHKRRFTQQVLKRLDANAKGFSEKATENQRQEATQLLAELTQQWQGNEPELSKATDELRERYGRKSDRIVSETPAENKQKATATSMTSTTPTSVVTTMNRADSALVTEVAVDSSSDKNWRQTLLQVADLLCERQPDAAIGYRLRRHAIWGMLTSPPMAQKDGRTPLAAVSVDRITDYLAELPQATLELWQQVEQSLTLAPYWLDGHALSARIAAQLGYSHISIAIRDELDAFLTRLPVLKTLCFADMTPFLSPETADWLQQGQAVPSSVVGGTDTTKQSEIWQCYHQQGLEVALQAVDQQQQQQQEPRDRFYSQLLSAQLLEQAGLNALAQQHYRTLLQVGQCLQLTDWEPGLFALLSEKQQISS